MDGLKALLVAGLLVVGIIYVIPAMFILILVLLAITGLVAIAKVLFRDSPANTPE